MDNNYGFYISSYIKNGKTHFVASSQMQGRRFFMKSELNYEKI